MDMVDQFFIIFLGPVTSFFVAVVAVIVAVVVALKLMFEWLDRQ